MHPTLLVAHGSLATSMLATTQMIIGPAPAARALDFAIGASVDELVAAVSTAVDALQREHGRPLVLVDLAGGSPSRAAAATALDGRADVIAGLNLPMAIEALTTQEADRPSAVRRAGSAGIVDYGRAGATGGGLR